MRDLCGKLLILFSLLMILGVLPCSAQFVGNKASQFSKVAIQKQGRFLQYKQQRISRERAFNLKKISNTEIFRIKKKEAFAMHKNKMEEQFAKYRLRKIMAVAASLSR